MSIKDKPFATYKLLRDEFVKHGYTTKETTEEGKLYIELTSTQNKAWKFKASHINFPFDNISVIELCRNKDQSYEFARQRGVNVPFTHYLPEAAALSDDLAEELVEKYAPLIVKPSDGALSKGLTLNIYDTQQLADAVSYAREYSLNILIQQQVEGEEIRFMVLEGKVAGALLRRTARVTGDGTSTIAQLIENENAIREKLVFPYISYPQLTSKNIDDSYLNDARIAKDGELVELNKATMIKDGASIYDIIDKIHPSYIRKIEALAAELDVKYLAVDIFTKNFEEQISDANYAFIEFNTRPAPRLCYGCRDGKMFDVIPLLFNVIDKHLHQS